SYILYELGPIRAFGIRICSPKIVHPLQLRVLSRYGSALFYRSHHVRDDVTSRLSNLAAVPPHNHSTRLAKRRRCFKLTRPSSEAPSVFAKECLYPLPSQRRRT